MVFSKNNKNGKKVSAAEVDIVRLVDDLFAQAVGEGASDIHFEPLRDKLVVRFRVDGIMRVVFDTDLAFYEHINARIKILANLETTGRPRPQEGNIKFQYSKDNDSYVDFRVSIFPTSTGECIVIRILESRKYFGKYKELGFTTEQVALMERTVHRPHGLILVTGPNGAGKSTTLFTILNKLNNPEKSLVTLEDPVERKIEMVRQTNIDPEIGLTFAEGLRYLLRQDPDIMMVGEIRDKETARIAIESAVTGHLVLATIHTNNAAGGVVRLINMGIEPFLLSSALKMVTAQRLARLLCDKCKKEYDPPQELVKRLKAPDDVKFHTSKGCHECNNKGVSGRIGIHELLVVDRDLQELILTRPSDEKVNDLAVKNGMVTLRQSALNKVYKGHITIEEALRISAN